MADQRLDEAPSESVNSVNFSILTAEEIRRMSVKKITKPDILDAKNTPVPDGLYDPALGPINSTDSCKSCGQRDHPCPGHCGHIDLALPVYNPLLFRTLLSLLQNTCFFCHRFRLKEEKVQRYVSQLDLIRRGDIMGARHLDELSLSQSVFSEENEVKCAAIDTYESHSSSKNLKQKMWTSAQHAEANSVIGRFTKERCKKCGKCGKKNPTVTSPMFGWLNRAMQDFDIRANFIVGSDLGPISTYGDGLEPVEGLQSMGDNASLTDDESSVPTHISKETKNVTPEKHSRGLPADFLKQKMLFSGQKHLVPLEVKGILKDLWENEAQLCMFICDIQQENLSLSGKNKGHTMFLLEALLVPPSKFRPSAGNNSGGVLEHPHNILLSKIQESNISLRNAFNSEHPDIVRRWMDLQRTVNVLFDSSKGFVKSDREISGLRQLVERKEGILRQKIMGKRVNFACRSVISPDPYLAVNEIGIPPYFALKLTYPERVTPWNVNKLRHAIINGTELHPGATHYKDKDSKYILKPDRKLRNAISRKLPTSRGILGQSGKGPESEFEGKVVYRHLQDGDIVLVNRQPTLHKPSMMAHVVRVLKGEKTIRMHYANCSAYNADFDGDEMNVHLPQDEISRAESFSIVNANRQYIVPTSGEPIRGLIQDHIISAVLLTKKDTFLTREEYHQLLYASCMPTAAPSTQLGKSGQKVSILNSTDDVHRLLPAILKPTPLWTGKQVITAILCHITRGCSPFTVKKAGKIPKTYLGANKHDHTLLIRNNEFMYGVIDKNQFGKYGLVHMVHELYGADTAGILLSAFSRLFTVFLQMHGFTCGIDDLLIVQSSDLERKRILEKSEVLSEDVHLKFIGSTDADIDPVELQRKIEKILRSNGESATTRLDRVMSSKLNNDISSVVNNALVPGGLLKPFPRNCLSLMTTTGAKGSNVNFFQISSLLGQQELEGKRVPRMVSGKTLPCFPPWDISSRAGGFITDRFLTGLRPQEYYFHCMAGRDGLVDTAIKTSRSGYLQRCLIKNLESLKVCYDHTVRDVDGSVVQFMYGEDGVDVHKTSFNDQFKSLAANHRVILERLSSQLEDPRFSKSNGFIEELPNELRKKATTFASQLAKKPRGSLRQTKLEDFMKLMKLKYLSSLAEPGEPVGVIAAQSVGEPSTQMTLNTFHHAGQGEMNVTLGIPRLQEILMNARENIQTPVMICPLPAGTTRDDADRLAAKLKRVTVADIVESMEVCTVPFSIHKHQVSTIYKLKMKLYPPDLYPPHSNITLETCKATLRTSFVEVLEDAIEKHLDTVFKISDISVISGKEESRFAEETDEDEPRSKSSQGEDNGGGGGGGDDDDDSEDEGTEDQGADAEKRKRQVNDEMDYEDGMDKERDAMADEHYEGEPSSGYENETDQVEADGDYTMGGETPSFVNEAESPESPSEMESVPISRSSRKELKSETKKTSKPKRRRKNSERVIFVEAKGLKFEVHFVFQKEPHILLTEIAQKAAKCVYVKESTNIERCSVVDPDEGKKKEKDPQRFELHTAGINFPAIWDLEDHLDVKVISTNNIYAMLNTYGVEAARATIIREVNNVFDSYGIQVNNRHLNLIADFMTFHGGFRPMSRIGMTNFATSPFGKMSFETATKFIVEAALHGEVDTLESPSASVCLGQPIKMGTGCFDLMQNLQL